MAPREGYEASTGARASGEHPHGARGPLSPRGGAPLPEDVPDFLLFCDPPTYRHFFIETLFSCLSGLCHLSQESCLASHVILSCESFGKPPGQVGRSCTLAAVQLCKCSCAHSVSVGLPVTPFHKGHDLRLSCSSFIPNT